MSMKDTIQHTLKLITAVLVALEISIPPNPYKMELILCLVALICLKYDIPQKIEDSISNLINRFN